MRNIQRTTVKLLTDKQTQSFLHGAQFSLIIQLQIVFLSNVSVAMETIIAAKNTQNA